MLDYMNTNGIIVVDKPAGWTSHDVVAKIRGALKHKCSRQCKQRVGHGGTLDPMATGVLPVFAGKATRAAVFCENAEKEYIAGIKPGITTDTQDITGSVLSRTDAHMTDDDISAVLPRFTGKQKQTPPMYSAIRQDGKRLYELARQGVEVERKERDIEIYAIEMIHDYLLDDRQCAASGEKEFFIRVVCSKGTYIRTLCHDLGNMLGCGAVMSYLRRTKAGVFSIDMAHPLEEVISQLAAEDICNNKIILPVDSIFSHYPRITLSAADTQKMKNGSAIKLRETLECGQYRVYAPGGEFLLLGEVIKSELKTVKSFFEV